MNKFNTKGYTLIEVILVMAIVLTVGVGATGFYGRFLTQNAVGNTVDQIVQNFRKAQSYAMESRKSNASGWGVNYASSTITLYQGATYGGRNQALDEKFAINGNITVSPSSFDINFARMTGIPNPVSITISGQGNSKTVTLNSQGMVTR